MNLDDALQQISDIRQQMVRTATFRGFGSITTLFSAIIAVGAAVLQAIFIPNPSHDLEAYFQLWFSAGLLCAGILAGGMTVRYLRSDSPLDRQLASSALQQFLPCLIVGGLLTYVMMMADWQALWIMPGLWTIFFGLGVLALRPLLPAGTMLVGMFYLLAGLISIAFASAHARYSPWCMGLPFGIGQSVSALILYLKLERTRG